VRGAVQVKEMRLQPKPPGPVTVDGYSTSAGASEARKPSNGCNNRQVLPSGKKTRRARPGEISIAAEDAGVCKSHNATRPSCRWWQYWLRAERAPRICLWLGNPAPSEPVFGVEHKSLGAVAVTWAKKEALAVGAPGE